MVKGPITPGGTGDVLVVLGKDCFQVAVIDITCYDGDCFLLLTLLFVDGNIQFIKCRCSRGVWWNVNSCEKYRRKLSQQLKRTQFNSQILQNCGT